MTVIDVTEASWATEVLERSRALPVVVDFWAAWCGPCRALGPILEAEAARHEGQVVLAKLDTDANQGIAGSFDIRGIPAVKAFRDAQVVDEFVGAQPPASVERFFAGLIPSEADTLVGAGDEQSLRRAVELEPTRGDAAVPLARLLLARGDRDGARSVLDQVVGSFQAEGLAARLRLEDSLDDAGPLTSTVRDALAALDDGAVERSLGLLIDVLPGADGHGDDVRRVIVGELDVLGAADPVAREARRRLAAALY